MTKQTIEKLKELADFYGSMGNAHANGVHDGILVAIRVIEDEN